MLGFLLAGITGLSFASVEGIGVRVEASSLASGARIVLENVTGARSNTTSPFLGDE